MSDREFVAWSIACLSCGFTGEHPVPAVDGIPKVDRCRCPKCSNSAYVFRPLRHKFVIAALCKEVVKLKLDLMDLQSMAEEMEDIRVALSRLTDKPAVQPDREAALREALEAVNAKWRSGADTPDEMRGLALAEAAILDLIDKPGHVNETPKSEHDARNMLTPATKGKRDD